MRALINVVACCCLVFSSAGFAAEPFVAFDAGRAEQPAIVLQHDAATGAGFDWKELTAPRVPAHVPAGRLRDAVLFLREGIQRLTGSTLEVRSAADVSRGIVVLLARHAPADLQNDPAVRHALRNDGSDSYNDREAFFLRSERDRLLIIANTIDGLVAAMPTLLESVGYEVLGMGPNWTHVPREHRRRLVFQIAHADRPSYYLRQLTPTSGQSYGVGTIVPSAKVKLGDPADEAVGASYTRWAIGIRNLGRSMAPFPGHAMQAHHRKVVERMLETGATHGFLTAANHLGRNADRPLAAEANASQLWINTDAQGEPAHGKVFLSNGKEWKECNLAELGVNLDPTSPLARQVVIDSMKQRAEQHFAEYPDEPFVFPAEPEDGAGYAKIGQWMRPEFRGWYPKYLAEQGVQFPQPYKLHGYRGIDQPLERWDDATPANTVFGFSNWLLREFDRWIDSRPEAERVTKTGHSKKELARCSLYSYAFHDVPPHINLDSRIRVMIAGYPKHRGLAEWKRFATQHDIAAAFRELLPREPSGEYRIISISYYADYDLEGIPARWSAAPKRIVDDLKGTYDAGIRALTCETDFNFGKYGLAYYLMSKVLWNARLTADELDTLRDRWLRRAYGSGWQEMKRYYDFMLTDNFPANSPAAWGKAIRLIDAADARIDPATEPDEQRRVDDLKQFWYFYYLLDSNQASAKSAPMIELAWKGQMSYMNAMHMVLRRVFEQRSPSLVAPDELRAGPAHFSTEETAGWWKKILEHWPDVPVKMFADTTLANGQPAREVDPNDLVRVTNFQRFATGNPFLFNSAQAPPTQFVTVARAGETIGCKFSWPADPAQLRFYGPKDVPFRIDFWETKERRWMAVVDESQSIAPSQPITVIKSGKPRHLSEVRHTAARAGTYRIEVGRGGFLAELASLGYDPIGQSFSQREPLTFFSRMHGLTQDPVFFYIPRGTKSLDLEVWDGFKRKSLQLYRGVNEKGLMPSREVNISQRGTHRVELQANEDGQLARISGNGFAFPLLYSVPNFYAKSPAELIIPRAIAVADGLLIDAE